MFAVCLLVAFVALLQLGFAHAKDVYVMMPLDTVSNNGTITNRNTTANYLSKIHEAGAAGIMIDVWWGIAEKTAKNYNFAPWLEIAEMCKSYGLKMQVVASFHKCGTNVNDNVVIPIPQFVLDAAGRNELFYRDQWNATDDECLSVSADDMAVFGGRTAVDMYYDFIDALVSKFSGHISSGLLTEIQIGMGPAGELRYPAYQSDKWKFPYVGGFQCWDKYMLEDFRKSAAAAGHPEWNSPPTDAGNYKSMPNDTSFFTNGYSMDYGRFFLNWYQQKLIDHADKILTRVMPRVSGTGIGIAVKIAGIHWLYNHPSHAAELTSGYWNCNNCGANGYRNFAQVFAKHGVTFDFTCLEMGNNHDDAWTMSRPFDLVRQTMNDVYAVGFREYAGENALEVYGDWNDKSSFNNILNQVRYRQSQFKSLTYLRATQTLLYDTNFNNFKNFVRNMKNIE